MPKVFLSGRTGNRKLVGAGIMLAERNVVPVRCGYSIVWSVLLL